MPFLKLGDLIQNMHPYCFFWQSTSYPHFQWGWICISYHKSHGSSRPRKQAPWLLMRGRIPGPLAATIRQSVSPVLKKNTFFFANKDWFGDFWCFFVMFCDFWRFFCDFWWYLLIQQWKRLAQPCDTCDGWPMNKLGFKTGDLTNPRLGFSQESYPLVIE